MAAEPRQTRRCSPPMRLTRPCTRRSTRRATDPRGCRSRSAPCPGWPPTPEEAPPMPRSLTARPVPADDLARLAEGRLPDPHAVLGAHPHDGCVTVRTLKPMAASVAVVIEDPGSGPARHE